jgi:hypothetical protein
MSAMTIRPSNNVECRYCHAHDHVKGRFDKNRQQYLTLCPKLLAKARRESNSVSFRRQAAENSRRQRQTAFKSGAWIDVNSTPGPTRKKAKSPGPRLSSRKTMNRFAAIEIDDEFTAVETRQTKNVILSQPLLGQWRNKLRVENNKKPVPKPVCSVDYDLSLQPDEEQRSTVTPTDEELKNKKRLHRVTQLKAEIETARADLEKEEKNATSWADEGDVEDARLRLECLEEKLARIQ